MTRHQKQIDFWHESAERSWKAALSLFKNKHYDSCLFFCHLAIEKVIKGLVVQNKKIEAPFIHDLEKLARLAELKLTDEQVEILRVITTFNIAGRYADAKFEFYKKCDKKYTDKYLQIARKIFLWLKQEYQPK